MKLRSELSASIMCANLLNMEPDLAALRDNGVAYLHCDVMDGHFVPNLMLSTAMIKAVKQRNLLPLDILAGHAANLPNLPPATDTIGIRPGALTIAEPDGPATRLTGTIELIEPLGGEFHVHLRLGDHTEALVASLPIDTRLEEAADLTLHAPHTDLHPFNARTGRRTDLN